MLETAVIRAETSTSLVLFCNDASTFLVNLGSVVFLWTVFMKKIFVSEVGMTEIIGEDEAVLKVFKFHYEAMKHFVASVIDVNEARNFYYSVAPFEVRRYPPKKYLDAANLKQAFFTALDRRVSERKDD